MREDFYEDDDDEYEEDDVPPEERDASRFNDLMMAEITESMAQLSNRGLIECLCYVMDKIGFTESTELVLVGMEFDQQYMLQFYNVREDKTFKTLTGAGNIYMLLDGWVRKTLGDLYFYRIYGPLAEATEENSMDVWLNFMLDVEEWKKTAGLDAPPEDHEGHEDPDAPARA